MLKRSLRSASRVSCKLRALDLWISHTHSGLRRCHALHRRRVAGRSPSEERPLRHPVAVAWRRPCPCAAHSAVVVVQLLSAAATIFELAMRVPSRVFWATPTLVPALVRPGRSVSASHVAAGTDPQKPASRQESRSYAHWGPLRATAVMYTLADCATVWFYANRILSQRTTTERQLRNLRVENPEFSDVLSSLDIQSHRREKRRVTKKVKSFDAANYNSAGCSNTVVLATERNSVPEDTAAEAIPLHEIYLSEEMEDPEEHDSVTSEPQEQSEGSSSEQSNAEDDEWRPCRRKVVRRVNLQRSQATKLMWQRKRAAALLLQQQEKQQEQDECSPGVMGPSRSSGLTGTATTLDRQAADIRHSVKALAVSAASKCKSTAAQQQPPTRRRRFPAKASETASSGSSASGSRGRTKRMPSLNMTWQQRKLARLRLSRFKTRDPLSRAIFRRDPVRFSMCWSDTTLGSSFAGKPSLKPKEESNKSQKSSFLGLKPYHHISTHSAAGRAEIVEELATNEMEFSEVNARPYLERACRPKMFQKDESSGSEASEDDECDSTADAAEKMSDTDESDESVTELPPERPTLRPKLLQTSRSRSYSRSHSYSRPHSLSRAHLGEGRKQEAAPLVAAVKLEPKEPPSERRSRAKRLWWEQIKQLDLRLAGGGGGAPGTSPPSTSTEQHEDSGPTEDRNQYLARSLALLRCRQYRHDLIAQMDLQQRARPQRHYNARGVHIASNKDACDCLQPNCPGCHFPCPKCGSQKCGDECRCSRNYIYDQIEVDGYTNAVFVNTL
ncbi:hypothetical protein HPB50_016543 [Hyalomma asiaticum]|uniref:Uncharacterized protein n=1 Tax=Hyalomma asiaticum TaxID=266040 RepID=A0ACB7SZ79_HYAAI|nr:hypothetical protein HPB50_016543 [Hyalomma asiaticum]